ncbi:MAG: hypothetical protein ACOC2G_01390 [Bacillota bacterium]
MDRIKSAYEIAMEKAEEISEDVSVDEDLLSIREEIKPILSKFYNGELDADQLWQEFENKEEIFLREAQSMILDSLGLRTTEDNFADRKNAILALESLKKEGQTSQIERALNKINKLQKRYSSDRDRIEQQLEQEMNNSEMQMKQVQTDDGRTVMKMEPGMDRETQQKFKKAISQTESQYSEQFSHLIEDIKNQL